MKASFTYTCASAILLSNYFTASAQTKKPRWEVSLNISSFIYQGYLSPSTLGSFKTPAFGIGVSGTRILSDAFSVRGNINFGKIKGDESKYDPEWRQERNFKFSSSLFEISANLVYDVFWNNYGKNSRNFSPYLFAGLGFTRLNVQRDHSNFNTTYFSTHFPQAVTGLSEDATTTPPRSAFVLPAGAGIKYSYNQKVIFFAEGSYRFMFTDYLDGYSKGANPKNGDHYYQYSIGITYRFGNTSILCPAF